MTGGAGFTKDGIERSRVNRSWLKKKLPFQRIKDNYFTKTPEIRAEMSESTFNDLIRLKKERKNRLEKRRKVFQVTMIIMMVIILIIFVSIFSRPI